MSHSNVHMIGPAVYYPFTDYCPYGPYCPMVLLKGGDGGGFSMKSLME